MRQLRTPRTRELLPSPFWGGWVEFRRMHPPLTARDNISLLFSSPQGPRSAGQRHATSAAAELPGEGGGQARATACAIYPGSAGGGRAWRQSVLPW